MRHRRDDARSPGHSRDQTEVSRHEGQHAGLAKDTSPASAAGPRASGSAPGDDRLAGVGHRRPAHASASTSSMRPVRVTSVAVPAIRAAIRPCGSRDEGGRHGRRLPPQLEDEQAGLVGEAPDRSARPWPRRPWPRAGSSRRSMPMNWTGGVGLDRRPHGLQVGEPRPHTGHHEPQTLTTTTVLPSSGIDQVPRRSSSRTG